MSVFAGVVAGFLLCIGAIVAYAFVMHPKIEDETEARLKEQALNHFEREIVPRIREKMYQQEGIISLKALEMATEAMQRSLETGMPVELEIGGHSYIVTPPRRGESAVILN